MINLVRTLFILSIALVLFILIGIPFHVKKSSAYDIYTDVQYTPTSTACLVPGAMIWNDIPSLILEDRLNGAVELFQQGKVDRIIVSGDHRDEFYNEVAVMKRYLIENGIDSTLILEDPQGFNTYLSIKNVKETFGIDSVIVASQEYHLPRALFLGKRLGIHTIGLTTDYYNYPMMGHYRRREYLAQIKSFFESL